MPNHAEKLISGLGAFTGIFATYWISSQFLGTASTLLMVGSMGAGTVLLFAVPHAKLSQPWPALASHLIASGIGVSVASHIFDPLLAAPLSVSLAVIAMHYLRCLHPPGGATALIAVIGGADVQALDFTYVTLVMLNAVSLVGIAILFNYPFKWRRYPAALSTHPATRVDAGELSIHDIEQAIQAFKGTVDITEDELLELYQLAKEKHSHQKR